PPPLPFYCFQLAPVHYPIPSIFVGTQQSDTNPVTQLIQTPVLREALVTEDVDFVSDVVKE
ncbi:Hypothetical predicted protein, partial [Olea europaea subsp. europaea]